ncbi:MAG TPA: AI-2E family transporter, partial [Chloroflexota bacterium]|nr:AI-2E family transporter [Chloroflexota bacterium]
MLRDPWLRALAILGCAIAGFYLLGLLWQVVQELADIILLFFLAWLLAFVLEPLVAALIEVIHLPRLAAIGLTYLFLLIVLTSAVIVLVPALALQVVEIARNLPTYSERVLTGVTDLQANVNTWLLGHGSPVVFDVKSAL